MDGYGNAHLLQSELQHRRGVPFEVVRVLSFPELHGLTQVLPFAPVQSFPPGVRPLVAWVSQHRREPYENLAHLPDDYLLGLAREIVANILAQQPRSAGAVPQNYAQPPQDALSNHYGQQHSYPGDQAFVMPQPSGYGNAGHQGGVLSSNQSVPQNGFSPAPSAQEVQQPGSAQHMVPPGPVMNTPSTPVQSPAQTPLNYSPSAAAVNSPYPVLVYLSPDRRTWIEGQIFSEDRSPASAHAAEGSFRAMDLPEYTLPMGAGSQQLGNPVVMDEQNVWTVRNARHQDDCACHDCQRKVRADSFVTCEDDDGDGDYVLHSSEVANRGIEELKPAVVTRGRPSRAASSYRYGSSFPDVDTSSSRRRAETSHERSRRHQNVPLPPARVEKLLERHDKDRSAKFTDWELMSMSSYRKYQNNRERRKSREISSHYDREKRREEERRRHRSSTSSSSYGRSSSTIPSRTSGSSNSSSRR